MSSPHAAAIADKSYYHALGVSESANAAAITHAYRRLARQLHPDKAGPGHEEQFKRVTQAYGVLSDHRKRELYHQYGPSLAPSAGDQVASTFDLIVPVMGGILAGCVIGTMYSSGMVGMLMAVVLALAAMLGLTQAAGGTVPFSTTAKSVLGGGVVTVALGAVIALVVQAVPASH